MRRILLTGLLTVAGLLPAGCVVPIYSSQPDVRARQLIYSSENLRHVTEIWERMWFLEMPDTAQPYRTHGGVI